MLQWCRTIEIGIQSFHNFDQAFVYCTFWWFFSLRKTFVDKFRICVSPDHDPNYRYTSILWVTGMTQFRRKTYLFPGRGLRTSVSWNLKQTYYSMLCDNIANLFLWTPGTGKKKQPPPRTFYNRLGQQLIFSQIQSIVFHRGQKKGKFVFKKVVSYFVAVCLFIVVYLFIVADAFTLLLEFFGKVWRCSDPC